MNPLTNTRKINELNDHEVRLGISEHKSWHQQYKDSAWIFVGGLPYEISEGDIICIFSQYGEPVNLNLVRDQKTGKSKGFCFVCYEDQRSTILAVDNFNGTKICGRTIRVDHVANYRPPKEGSVDEIQKMLADVGCGPDVAKDLEKKAAQARLQVSLDEKTKPTDDRNRSASPPPIRPRDHASKSSRQPEMKKERRDRSRSPLSKGRSHRDSGDRKRSPKRDDRAERSHRR